MSEFKIGDTVRLKGGGPKMTVREIWSNNQCLCDWFEGKKLMSGRFEIDQLITEDPDELITGFSVQ
jgi:uncharacterized protein YodC (DUF2158 family)